MPLNSMNTGRDLNFALVTPYGNVNFSQVTEYAIKQETSDIKSLAISGETNHGVLPHGWTISVKLDRRDGSVDRLFARLEADYYAGVNIRGGTVNETIREADGTISEFRYENVILKLDDAGSYKGDAIVSQSVTLMASRRKQVS